MSPEPTLGPFGQKKTPWVIRGKLCLNEVHSESNKKDDSEKYLKKPANYYNYNSLYLDNEFICNVGKIKLTFEGVKDFAGCTGQKICSLVRNSIFL